MIVAIKLLHIAALIVWCAGLVGLPLVLAKHDPEHDQADYSHLRILTHRAYIGVVTPSAVIAIAMGTALIFMREVFVPWMFAKLVMVGVLVFLHAWIGHVTLNVGERQGSYDPPPVWPLLVISIAAMLVILTLVLGKPLLSEAFAPEWLTSTRDQPLPMDEVPI